MTGPTEPLPAADDDLWALVGALVDGTPTAAERERLDQRLRAEPEARLFYVAYLDLHAQLQWRTRGASAAAPGLAQPHVPPSDIGTAPARIGLARRFAGHFVPPWARAVVAASLLLAAGLLVTFLARHDRVDQEETPDFPDAPAGSVAVLIDSPQTVWETDMSLPTETGSALPPGALKLKAGVVAVAFRSGGEVLLEGPADFDIRASDLAFLHRGKLTAKVPEGAPAFRIGMPGVVVTDLGGECGLWRDDAGRSEVHVFAGQVEADPTDRQGEPMPGKRLLENAGASINASLQTLTPVPLNEGAFAHLRPEIRVADACVRDGLYAGRNSGAAPRLAVKNSIPNYSSESYLRFDLSGVKGKVTEARVRLVPVRVGQQLTNAAAFVADNQWGESTLTWDTKPLSRPAFVTWTATEGKPVEFDVTGFVREALAGDKMLSLRIFAPEQRRGNSVVVYGSRRGESESRPQLLVTVVP